MLLDKRDYESSYDTTVVFVNVFTRSVDILLLSTIIGHDCKPSIREMGLYQVVRLLD